MALAFALGSVSMVRGEEAPPAAPAPEQPAVAAPTLKAGRFTERTDRKTSKRILTVWLKNDGMADFKGTVALLIRGKGAQEEQRSEVAAAVPVHQERAVEVEIRNRSDNDTASSRGQSAGFSAVVSVEVQSSSAAVAAK